MTKPINNMQEETYLVGGQNIQERTENVLLDHGFDFRFLTGGIFSVKKAGLEGYSLKSERVLKQEKRSKPGQLEIIAAVLEEPLFMKIRSLVTDKQVEDYVSASEWTSAAISQGGLCSALVGFHEKIEIHEFYKAYTQFCKEANLAAGSMDSAIASIGLGFEDETMRKFIESGRYSTARDNAHKKALIAENMFLYGISKRLGFKLNFAALVDANPLRQSDEEKEGKSFVKSFCHGFRKDYSEEDFENAVKFYEHLGINPPSKPCYR